MSCFVFNLLFSKPVLNHLAILPVSFQAHIHNILLFFSWDLGLFKKDCTGTSKLFSLAFLTAEDFFIYF